MNKNNRLTALKQFPFWLDLEHRLRHRHSTTTTTITTTMTFSSVLCSDGFSQAGRTIDDGVQACECVVCGEEKRPKNVEGRNSCNAIKFKLWFNERILIYSKNFYFFVFIFIFSLILEVNYNGNVHTYICMYRL